MLLESFLVNHTIHYSITHMIMHLFLRRDTTIVRVNLENFMQCESAEFRPEPDLSMLMDLGNEERTALYSGIVLGFGGDYLVSLGIPCVRRYQYKIFMVQNCIYSYIMTVGYHATSDVARTKPLLKSKCRPPLDIQFLSALLIAFTTPQLGALMV